jgi:hypothetical protein
MTEGRKQSEPVQLEKEESRELVVGKRSFRQEKLKNSVTKH